MAPQNRLGDTALHLAAWRGRAALVALLLRHGADQRATNAEGQLARHLARDADCAALLRPPSVSSAAGDADDYGGDDDSD